MKNQMEMIRRDRTKVIMTITQRLMLPPLPTKVKEIWVWSSLKSTPFIDTDTRTFSSPIEEGSSWMLGVRQRMVVELMYVAGEVPNLPNLHFMLYSPPVSLFDPGAGRAVVTESIINNKITYVEGILGLDQRR